MKGVFEVPPPLSGGKYRYFVKPRKALAMSGKEIPEARFCILHKHVQEVREPISHHSPRVLFLFFFFWFSNLLTTTILPC